MEGRNQYRANYPYYWKHNTKQYYNIGQGIQLEDWTSYVGNNSEKSCSFFESAFCTLEIGGFAYLKGT
jgi:hypothetical protein